MFSFEQKLVFSRYFKRLQSILRRVFYPWQRLSKQKIVYTEEQHTKKLNSLKTQIVCPLPSDESLKRVEIIILSYNSPEIESVCVKKLLEYTAWPYKLVVFDNRPGTKNMSKVWNKLIRESTCEYILIMDSDVFVPDMSPCWLTRLMKTFDDHKDCYVVSPKVTRTSSSIQQAYTAREDAPVEKIEKEFAGMCVLYKKEIFEKNGYFDEDFLLYGSDSEWARRMVFSPYSGYIRPDVVVDHVGHYSAKKSNKIENEYDYTFERQYAANLLEEKTKYYKQVK